MYAIYANIGGILMVNVTIYSSTMDPMGNKSVTSVANQMPSVYKARSCVSRVSPLPLPRLTDPFLRGVDESHQW